MAGSSKVIHDEGAPWTDGVIMRSKVIGKCRTRMPFGLPHGIDNRSGGSSNPDLPYSLDAQWIHVWIDLFDQDGFERWQVGVHRYVILGKIRVS